MSDKKDMSDMTASEISYRKFLKNLGNPFSIILVDKSGVLSIEFGGYGIPETFLINKDKKIIKTLIGNLSIESVRQINSIVK